MLKRSSLVAKRSGFVYIKNANRFRQSVQNNWLARCSFSSIRVRRWSLHVLVFCNTQLYFLLFEKWHQQLDASTSCKVCKDMTSIYSLEQSLKSPWTWLSTCTFQNILEYSNTLLCTSIMYHVVTFEGYSWEKLRLKSDEHCHVSADILVETVNSTHDPVLLISI